MSEYNVHKVTAIPASYAANDVFFVAPSTDATALEVYVANSSGTALRRMSTKSDIQGMIDASILLVGTGSIVDLYSEMSGITAPKDAQQVLVIDATEDPTVSSGAATYVYKAATSEWIKISEAEGMDVVATWDAITGKPNASPVDIDSAVAQMHSHSNKTEVDLIGQNVDGFMTYNGELPKTGWATEAW